MYNSPNTPTGTGSILPSNTYVCTFAIGRPIESRLSSFEHSVNDVHTVASVGPYALINLRSSAQHLTISVLQASPAEIKVRNSGNGTCGNTANSDGGKV